MLELVELVAAVAFGVASLLVAGKLVRNPPKEPASRASTPSIPDVPFIIDPGKPGAPKSDDPRRG